ncbi:hypothetical protein A7U60_g1800 [Sanghuangporus baumii]|uniref:Uncharacterized protein n=1 Tax=Sanghuangporus baumii TaxID=108892 RepID=A0A9Q5N8V2_SANBA|nr:hypothetical protein A7U60_g1800 [Sanghuangporus baumii]
MRYNLGSERLGLKVDLGPWPRNVSFYCERPASPSGMQTRSAGRVGAMNDFRVVKRYDVTDTIPIIPVLPIADRSLVLWLAHQAFPIPALSSQSAVFANGIQDRAYQSGLSLQAAPAEVYVPSIISIFVKHTKFTPHQISYWLACYPLDVIKSRVQLRATPPTGTPVQYIAHEFKTIVGESGFRGLFRGLSPSCMSFSSIWVDR